MKKEVFLFPKGVIGLPSSKSVSHRALICAGLAEGKSVLRGLSASEDINATITCLEALGARFSETEGGLAVEGGFPRYRGEILDCGESGSTLRFLIPAAALAGGETTFTGRGLLMERPMEPYVKALGANGVEIIKENGHIRLNGRLRSGVYELTGGVSSQFVSGLLFALPLLEGDSEIRLTSPLESASYVDLTLDALEKSGVAAKNKKYQSFFVRGGQRYAPANRGMEADFSHAAFFLAAGALGADCECAGLDMNSRQGDRKILDVLRECGIGILRKENGNIKALPGKIRPVKIDMSDIPDLAPPLAALLCFAEGTSELTNAARLRYKECDRLAVLAEELNKLGAKITEKPDGMVIEGMKSLTGGAVSGHNDHRIPMALAVAAIRAEGRVYIEGAECVAKSYPLFWDDFEKGELRHG